MMKCDKELEIVEIWTGGQTTESIQHISTVPSTEKVSCLTIRSISPQKKIKKMIDKDFKKAQSDLQAMNLMLKEALIELCSQRENFKEFTNQMISFSIEVSNHFKNTITNQSFNELVQGHNRHLNILSDLAKTLKCNIRTNKNQITKISSDLEIIQQRKFSMKKTKSFKRDQDHHELNLSLPINFDVKQKEENNLQKEQLRRLQQRISRFEEKTQKQKTLNLSEGLKRQQQILKWKRYFQEKLEKYDDRNKAQINNIDNKVKLLSKKLDATDNNLKEKKIEVKECADETSETLKISFQRLSLQVAKMFEFQADILMKVNKLASDFDNSVSFQTKKIENFEIQIQRSINFSIEQIEKQITERFSNYQKKSQNSSKENSLGNNQNKISEENYHKNFFCQKNQILLKKEGENEYSRLSQSTQRLEKYLLLTEELKNKVDLSQIFQIPLKQFQYFPENKFKIFDRAFKIQDCFQILYGSYFVILHSPKANLGIVIFYQEPDVTLYPRFSNDLLSDLITITFHKLKSDPFLVIHTNMSTTGAKCYTTDITKYLYRSNEEPLKGNPQQDVQNICKDLSKLNKRKKMPAIRYQFSSFYESLNLEQRVRLTEKNIDIYNFKISNFPVRFQISPKPENFKKQLNNQELKWFIENNSVLHKNLSPHQSCREYQRYMCESCNQLFIKIHTQLTENQMYEYAIGYLLQLFNKNGDSLGIWYHFSANTQRKKHYRLLRTKKNFLCGYALIFQGQILSNKGKWREKLFERYDQLIMNLEISKDIITKIGAIEIISTITVAKQHKSELNFYPFLEKGYLLSTNVELIENIKDEIFDIFGISLRIISYEQSEKLSVPLLSEGYPLWLTKAKYIKTPKRGLEKKFGIHIDKRNLHDIRQKQIQWKLLQNQSKKKNLHQESKKNPFYLRKYVIRAKNETQRSRSREKMKQKKKKYEQQHKEMLPSSPLSTKKWEKYNKIVQHFSRQ